MRQGLAPPLLNYLDADPGPHKNASTKAKPASHPTARALLRRIREVAHGFDEVRPPIADVPRVCVPRTYFILPGRASYPHAPHALIVQAVKGPRVAPGLFITGRLHAARSRAQRYMRRARVALQQRRAMHRYIL